MRQRRIKVRQDGRATEPPKAYTGTLSRASSSLRNGNGKGRGCGIGYWEASESALARDHRMQSFVRKHLETRGLKKAAQALENWGSAPPAETMAARLLRFWLSWT